MPGPLPTSCRTASFVVAVTLLAGCRSIRKINPLTTSARPRMTEQQLAARLRSYCSLVGTSIGRTSTRVVASTKDPKLRHLAIAWKVDNAAAARRALTAQRPTAALIEIWAGVIRAKRFFETDGRKLFGNNTTLIAQTYGTLLEEIAAIAREFLMPKVFRTAEADVEKFASENPVRAGEFSVGGAHLRLPVATESWFTGLLDAATSPFAIATGVDDTARAIQRVSEAADRFTYVAAELPRDTRWQMELLMHGLDDNPAVATLLEDIHRVSEGVDRLPERVQAQVARTLEDLDEKQVGLRQTLSDVEATVKSASSMFESMQRTAQSLEGAGRAWEPTIREIRRLAEGDPDAEPAPADPNAKPFEILDYAKTADALSKAASELRALLVDLNTTLGPDQLPKTAQSAIDHSTNKAIDFSDHVFWRAVQLVGVVLAGVVLYRLVSLKLKG